MAPAPDQYKMAALAGPDQYKMRGEGPGQYIRHFRLNGSHLRRFCVCDRF